MSTKFIEDLESRLKIINDMIAHAGIKDRKKLQKERSQLETVLSKARG